MNTPEKIDRIFKMENADMLEMAKTKRSFFIEDKADFIAFDSAVFSDPFVTQWQTAITTAEDAPSDDAIIDQITQLTEAVEAQMVLCRKHFQDAKYFIEKAFPKNQPVWNEFGYNDYEKCSYKQALMIQFMEVFHAVATKYAAQLNTNGYGALKVAQINALKIALNNANLAQETFIGDRPVSTQTRNILLNAVYTITVSKVCRAGRQIYQDNFAKYQRYLLPAGEQNEFPKEALIAPNATDTISGKSFPDTKEFVFKNTGSTQLVFCRGAADSPCPSGIILDAGVTETHALSDLGSGAFIKVTNQESSQGSWRMEEA